MGCRTSSGCQGTGYMSLEEDMMRTGSGEMKERLSSTCPVSTQDDGGRTRRRCGAAFGGGAALIRGGRSVARHRVASNSFNGPRFTHRATSRWIAQDRAHSRVPGPKSVICARLDPGAGDFNGHSIY